MDLNQKIIAGLLLAFFLITLLRIFRTPLRLALKLLMNTALGFLALWAVNATAAVTGVALGLNLLNALTVGVLGPAPLGRFRRWWGLPGSASPTISQAFSFCWACCWGALSAAFYAPSAGFRSCCTKSPLRSFPQRG